MVEESQSQALASREAVGEDEFSDFEFDEERRKREEIAGKLIVMASAIRVSFENSLGLLSSAKKSKFGGRPYVVFREFEEEEFDRELMIINEHLGSAHAMLDSYVRFTNSTPEFKQLFNAFYIFYERVVRGQRESIFFQIHAYDEGNYLYPFFRMMIGLQKLSFLLSRLVGTLRTGGEFIKDQPIRSTPEKSETGQAVYGQAGYGYRGYGYGGGSYGHRLYADDELSRLERERDVRRRKPPLRDIGDMGDTM